MGQDTFGYCSQNSLACSFSFFRKSVTSTVNRSIINKAADKTFALM